MRHVVFVMSCVPICLHIGAAWAQGAVPGPAPNAPPAPSGPAPAAGGTTNPAASAPPTGAARYDAVAPESPLPQPAPGVAPGPQTGYAGPPPLYAAPPPVQAPPPAASEVRTPWRPSDPGFILAVERLVGFYGMNGSGDVGGDVGGTVLSLAGNTGLSGFLDPFVVPQLSAHGVLGNGLTLGGAIGYQSTSPSTKAADLGSWSTFNIGPRIGFVAALSPSFAIWAKGGITYASVTLEGQGSTCTDTGCTSNTTTETTAWIDLSLDPMLVFFPIAHVGLLLGPAVDIGLSGSNSSSDSSFPSRSTKFSNYGVSGGLAVFL